jgi:hypothetical protein
MSAAQRATREILLNNVLSRSATDPAFRAGLLAAPKETINEVFGIEIPDKFQIRFIEKEAGLDALIVLPDPSPGGELTVDDLETVNGGGFEVEWDLAAW